MQNLDLLAIASLLASTASIVLAISAFIFGWVSFRRSSEMQVDAQKSLSKISDKAEVIVTQTSGQIKQAWDYFTRSPSERSSEEMDEITKREEEQKRAIVEEATQKALEEIQKAGMSPAVIKSLEKKLENIIETSTDRTVTFRITKAFERAARELSSAVLDVVEEHGASFSDNTLVMTLTGNALENLGIPKMMADDVAEVFGNYLAYKEENVLPSDAEIVRLTDTASITTRVLKNE